MPQTAHRGKRNVKVRRRSSKKGHNRKFVRFNIGILEVMKIKAAWLTSDKTDGSYTAVAKATGHDRATVAAVLNCPEMKAWAAAMNDELLRNCANEVMDRIHYEIRNRKSKNGPWMSMELADRWGAIPPKITKVAARLAMGGETGVDGYTDQPEDERVNYWVRRLSEVTVERQQLFDMPMPHLDAIKEEEEERKGKKELLLLPLKRKEQAE